MSDGIIYLSNVRLSFPHLVEPHSASTIPNAKKSYQADFIMEETHPSWQEVMNRVGELAQAQWAEHAQAVLQQIYNDRRLRFFGKGAERVDKKTMQPYSGYAGMVYVSGKRDIQPQFIKVNGQPVDMANTMEIQQVARSLYGGCYVNAAIRPWAQDNTHGRGMRCELVAVQFLKDGEAFGAGTTDASGMFGAVQGGQSGQATPAGMPLPNAQPNVNEPDAGMPNAPFPAPKMPGFMGDE